MRDRQAFLLLCAHESIEQIASKLRGRQAHSIEPEHDSVIDGYCSSVARHSAEQTAIAEVLSDMDAELVALEQRREKTRALKQGMMQELLTGRTRLV